MAYGLRQLPVNQTGLRTIGVHKAVIGRRLLAELRRVVQEPPVGMHSTWAGAGWVGCARGGASDVTGHVRLATCGVGGELQTILLVDDNKNILDFCKRELEREGYHVMVASDAREASRIVRARALSLVVVSDDDPLERDLTLFISRIWRRDVPIIVHAATELDAEEMTFWRAEACVRKTGDVAELKANIAQILARRETGIAEDFVDDEPVGSDDMEWRACHEEGVD